MYTLLGQKQMLSQKEDFSYYAFDGREKRRKNMELMRSRTEEYQNAPHTKGATPAMCTSMTPQGLAVTEDYVLVSAYCSTQKHNSVIYVIDKEKHNFFKEVILPGQPHVGGLAYDSEHKVLWYSSNIKRDRTGSQYKDGYNRSLGFMMTAICRCIFPDGQSLWNRKGFLYDFL